MLDPLPIVVLVAVHHALGAVGGARGVHQPVQIVAPDLGAGRRRSRPAQGAAVGLSRFVQPDDVGQAADHRPELGVGEQEPHRAVAMDVGGLLGGEAVIHRQKDGAQIAGREAELDEGEAVLHEGADHVAPADAAPVQESGHGVDPGDQVAVRNGPAAIDDGDTVRLALRTIAQAAGEIEHRGSLPAQRRPPPRWCEIGGGRSRPPRWGG